VTDFERVYDLYFRDVYRYAYSLCRSESSAEEITQETFFKALKSIDMFDGRCSVFVWLCQIAKNTYLSMVKKSGRTTGIDDCIELESDDATPEAMAITRDEAMALHRILHSLDEPYKEVFSLRTFGELSFAQIADLFGKSESWARVTYHRAKLKITGELK